MAARFFTSLIEFPSKVSTALLPYIHLYTYLSYIYYTLMSVYLSVCLANQFQNRTTCGETFGGCELSRSWCAAAAQPRLTRFSRYREVHYGCTTTACRIVDILSAQAYIEGSSVVSYIFPGIKRTYIDLAICVCTPTISNIVVSLEIPGRQRLLPSYIQQQL